MPTSATTVVTAVPVTDQSVYKRYLADHGFDNVELFCSHTVPKTLAVLFLERHEALKYHALQVEAKYLVLREHVAWQYGENFEDDLIDYFGT